MKYIERNGLRILISDFGYLIHNKNADSYSKKVYLGKFSSLDDFEEVEDKNIDKSLVDKINDLDESNIVQYDIMDTTMLVLDEIFNYIEPMIPEVMSIDNDENETKDPLINFYVIMIQRELKTLDDIPLKYKEQVIKILNK